MELIEKKENQIKFSIETSENLANAIRRYVNRIPILAIKELEISKNDSPLYDEAIAHRMGLIPLVNSKNYKKKLPKLQLNIKREGMVYAEDMVGEVQAAYGRIPITLLEKGGELKITADLGYGVGEEHAKFIPGLIFYRKINKLEIDKNCPSHIAEFCPKGVLASENNKLVAVNEINCDACGACLEACEKEGKPEAIKIIPTTKLLMTVESFGQIKSEDIFLRAVKILKEDLSNLSKKIK